MIDFDSLTNLLANLHSVDITIEDAEKEQDKYELLLDELNKIDKSNILKKQSDMIDKSVNFFYEREDIIAMFADHLEKTNIKGIKGTGLKTLTPNQMLKR